jgi:hypothetical protein
VHFPWEKGSVNGALCFCWAFRSDSGNELNPRKNSNLQGNRAPVTEVRCEQLRTHSSLLQGLKRTAKGQVRKVPKWRLQPSIAILL